MPPPDTRTPTPPTEGERTRWEYYRLTLDSQSAANSMQALGKEGWELVSVCIRQGGHMGSPPEAYFKRALSGGSSNG
jgi:hypothetical protein